MTKKSIVIIGALLATLSVMAGVGKKVLDAIKDLPLVLDGELEETSTRIIDIKKAAQSEEVNNILFEEFEKLQDVKRKIDSLRTEEVSIFNLSDYSKRGLELSQEILSINDNLTFICNDLGLNL